MLAVPHHHLFKPGHAGNHHPGPAAQCRAGQLLRQLVTRAGGGMTRETMGERQVRLEEQLKAVGASLATLAEQGKEAAESRRRGYQAQEEVRLEIVGIKNRLDGLERSVEAIKPTSVEYQQVRDRVIFAGKLGGVLWGAGKAILAAAAGAAAHWYSMTGRPPP